MLSILFAARRHLVVFCKGSPARTFAIPDVVIKLPDTLARVFSDTPEARLQRVTEDAAIEE